MLRAACAGAGLAGDALSALEGQSTELAMLRKQLRESQQMQAESQVRR